ncbi:hypothetical protein PtA15_8A772 [Puccinia triticina]|uniref:J domain-containing protein n=1 Tax=Puccinia triticina TaxID=208348 RepID=A0ABY7CS59_9BASI|nr:uncharacterized protein PtA15_8A772 [Puccinia triticina]WAQ87865.1 hypothetical protein PtA15_8A772 [Puccinia triticina]
MEGNRDEAQRAFKLAQSCQSTDPIKSLKFAKKACALYWSPEAAALVKTLETGEGPSTSAAPTGSSTATKNTSSSTTFTKRSTQPSTPRPSSSANKNDPPTFKPAQLELVKKVRQHKNTQYYEILELKREANESQIKSAYRKLALALHPDKNNAPGADEAFKMVSKAFQVLSDPDKRAAYDRHGADPDSRSAGVPTSSPFGGGRGGGGGMHFSHEDAIDPDQLFRMFFGGGGFDHPGMQFGGGPTVFQFGGGGTTFRRTGFNRRQHQQQNPNEPEVRTPSTWFSLLPIILFFGVSLIQSFPSLFSSPSTPDPSFSWNPSTVYPIQRVTQTSHGITYFVNPVEFATHPLWEEYLKANPGLSESPSKTTGEQTATEENKRALIQDLVTESRQLVEKRKANQRHYLVVPKNLQRFEQDIENSWVRKLRHECQNAKAHQEARKRELSGFLGIGSVTPH